MGEKKRDQVVQLVRRQRLTEGLRHHALAVRLAIGRPRHDIGVGIDNGLTDVAGRVRGVAVVVRQAHDARRFGGDVPEVRTDVAAGLVAVKPRIGAYVVAAWLWGIIVNLLMIPGYYDIALRDFGLSLGALALGRLAEDFETAE